MSPAQLRRQPFSSHGAARAVRGAGTGRVGKGGRGGGGGVFYAWAEPPRTTAARCLKPGIAVRLRAFFLATTARCRAGSLPEKHFFPALVCFCFSLLVRPINIAPPKKLFVSGACEAHGTEILAGPTQTAGALRRKQPRNMGKYIEAEPPVREPRFLRWKLTCQLTMPVAIFKRQNKTKTMKKRQTILVQRFVPRT